MLCELLLFDEMLCKLIVRMFSRGYKLSTLLIYASRGARSFELNQFIIVKSNTQFCLPGNSLISASSNNEAEGLTYGFISKCTDVMN
jgi:hypothetical protein